MRGGHCAEERTRPLPGALRGCDGKTARLAGIEKSASGLRRPRDIAVQLKAGASLGNAEEGRTSKGSVSRRAGPSSHPACCVEGDGGSGVPPPNMPRSAGSVQGQAPVRAAPVRHHVCLQLLSSLGGSWMHSQDCTVLGNSKAHGPTVTQGCPGEMEESGPTPGHSTEDSALWPQDG